MSSDWGYIQKLAKWELWAFPSLLGIILIAIAQYDYVVFHTLAELFAIVISFVMFSFAWATDGYTKNRFLIFLACGYLAIGSLDLVHAFVYQGVDFFVEGNGNQASQFWIATRYFEALLLLSVPSVFDRSINKYALLTGFVGIAIVVFAAIMGGHFPDTFIDGVGLTPFKIYSEYAINIILAGAIYRISRLGNRVRQTTMVLTIIAVIFTMASELMFTFYVDVYGLSNLVGHIFKIFSYWMIFQAVVMVQLRQPYWQLRRVHTAIDQSPAAVNILDTEGRVEFANPKFNEITGYSLENMLGQLSHLSKTFARVGMDFKDVLGTIDISGDFKGEYLSTRKDGSQFWEDVHITPIRSTEGAVVNFLVTSEDISHQIEIEKALLQSEDKHRMIINSTSQGYWMVDGNSITIDVNDALCKMLGYTRHEMIGSSVNNFVTAENEKIFISQHGMRYEHKQRQYEIELTTKDGRQIPTLFAATTMDTPDGQSSHSFALITDISEQRRVKSELVEHRDHLEKLVAERSAEIIKKAFQLEAALESEREYSILQQKFVSLVSHEFRTPLAIIDGSAQRLIRRKDKLDADEIETRANSMRAAVKRMVNLIETTLFIAHLDSGKVELELSPFNIAELITDVCDRQAGISTSHEIQVEIDDLSCKIIADPARIDQVFTNLLSNAVKYAPDNSVVEIKGWVNGGYMYVSVTDHGVGIPEDELPQMFHRFFRAKTAAGIKGTGIGLSVVKEVVEMHGGTITVASVEGEGSTFTICLPLDSQDKKYL